MPTPSKQPNKHNAPQSSTEGEADKHRRQMVALVIFEHRFSTTLEMAATWRSGRVPPNSAFSYLWLPSLWNTGEG